MRFIFLGPPGAGKGTQAARLAKHYSLLHCSTGDILRSALKEGTQLGIQAKSFMDRGELVPDSVTNALVRICLESDEAIKGFILDGYPRNVEQASELDLALEDVGANLDRVVDFKINNDEVVERLSGRRTCPVCQTPYHGISRPPAVEGICDLDGAELVHRADDKEETILRRLEVYHQQTEPLTELYRTRGLLVEVDALGDADQVFERLLEVVRK